MSIKNISLIGLSTKPWRGNIRELINLIAYLAVLTQDTEEITDAVVHSMIGDIVRPSIGSNGAVDAVERLGRVVSLESTKKDMEKNMFQELLGRKDLTKSQIAAKLGVSRTTFWRKCREYGLL